MTNPLNHTSIALMIPGRRLAVFPRSLWRACRRV